MTTTTTSATAPTSDGIGTTTMNGRTVEYYTNSLKAMTDIRTDGFSLATTVTAKIYADTPRRDEHGEWADYDVIWQWSITVDERGGQHLDYYEAIAKQLANLRINELQGEYDR